MENQQAESFWHQDIQFWIKQLNSSDNGLSSSEALKRRVGSGKVRKGDSGWIKDLKIFLSQFKSPLMLLLIGAVIISGFLGDTSDVVIVLFILLSSGLLSFFQERKAGKIVEKLQSLISIKATVLRDGQPIDIPSEDIVKGDVILLNAGDMIPADCRIIEANELHASESSLTGESYPVRKSVGISDESAALSKRYNCLWEGTSIVSGSAKALVIHTGSETLFGHIAHDVSIPSETSFEKGIRDFGFVLMKITLVLALFILIINLLSHKSVIESALFALALAVGMAPELLPAITTIAMSAGAKKLLAKKVIVKKLNSIQNLGEVSLLCTDKTGTITEGLLKVTGMPDAEGKESQFVKELALYNACFESGYSNPIDEALKKLEQGELQGVAKIGEVPYDFIRKRLSVAVRKGNQAILVSKGAHKQILDICTQVRLSDGNTAPITDHKEKLNSLYGSFGTKGWRAISVCYSDIGTESISMSLETNMTFAGFILLNDPVKPGIPDVINQLKSLSVDLKIITGDNMHVAESIARSIGIQEPVIMTAADLLKTSPEALVQLARNTHVFAEVEPEQKERIISALRHSFTVAYMGDGINDVAAINAADVGISVDNAVDIAREAADFVLMEKDLSVIVDGIVVGRKTFANTLKYLFISTGSTFGNMCSVAFASLALPFLPMLPKQILMNNFLTDFPFLSVTTDNIDQEQIEHPGKWDLKLIRRYMLVFGIHSSLFDLITFILLYFVMKVSETTFQTGWFIESVLTELLILFIIRTRKNFFLSKPGKYLIVLSCIAFVITLMLPYSFLASEFGLDPLPFKLLSAVLLIVLGYVITADYLKIWFFKRMYKA